MMLLFYGLAVCTIGGMVTSGISAGLAMATRPGDASVGDCSIPHGILPAATALGATRLAGGGNSFCTLPVDVETTRAREKLSAAKHPAFHNRYPHGESNNLPKL